MGKEDEDKWNRWLRPACIPITIVLALIVLIVLLPLLEQKKAARDRQEIVNFLQHWDPCGDKCRFTVIESIPENLTYNGTYVPSKSVYESWIELIRSAEYTIDIASSYWTLRGDDVWSDPSDRQGETIFSELLKAGTERKISIRIAQNQPSADVPDYDTQLLKKAGAAQVRSLDFEKLVGGGILHTKMWLVDSKHIYLGSANLDWRSLTQVKELGVLIQNCTCLGDDMAKLFQIYWDLGAPGAIVPPEWPPELSTDYNNTSPLSVKLNNSESSVYFSSSPKPLCTIGRLPDADAIVDVIRKANKFVYVAVMDYFPMTIYTPDSQYWPIIDDELRSAAINRGVSVRLLASHWNHTKTSMAYFLKSLQALNSSLDQVNVETKLFVVPSFTKNQSSIPFARVNHNKYMVTDNAVYVGTSNWAADYFINTGGIGIIVNQTRSNDSQPIREQVLSIFERDWSSSYARLLAEFINI